ncbi:MAG: translocation/assembly module TamB domain-containing protein, partial [Cyclobacteriaceae bacterium]
RWTVPADNEVIIDNGLWINNLVFENSGKKLSVYSKVQEQDTIQVFDMENFRLENLTSAFSESESLVGGTTNGHFEYDQANATFNSEVEIKKLTYTDKLLGDLSLQATNANDRIKLDGILSQNGGQAEIIGTIDPSNPDNTAINLMVDDLKIKNFSAFADEVIAELEGSLSGKVAITGDLADPQMNGSISTSNVMVKPTALNTSFYIDNEKITFDTRKITMAGFKILDAEKNSASLDGSIRLKEFLVDNINVTFSTNKFLVINSTEEQNDFMHAKAWIDTDVKITGDQNLLNINADIKLLENSDVVYTVPPLSNAIARGEGVVRWIDQDEKKAIKKKEKDDGEMVEKTETELSGFDIRMKIEVNDNSKLTVIIDPQSGDRLEARGDANLIFSMNPLGDMSMTGRYTVSEGLYKLNFYGLTKREFQIVEGGSVTWTGDVMEAQVDITARYVTDAIPPFSAINRKLPFYVNLNINGEILKPTLDFNLSMPPELRSQYGNVYTYLQDINSEETELNKQVFSLVLFNSFMVDNSSTSTPLLNNTARNSLSKIFSSQLNRLTGGIDAVDISLGLESYEFANDGNTNSRTDLSLDLSKSLLDDKLVIKVSSNINLEGEEAAANQNMSSFIGDVVLEYKLTEDG